MTNDFKPMNRQTVQQPLSHEVIAALLNTTVEALEAKDIAMVRLVEKAHGIS